ncbi:MAG: MlrC C-terminal domain-containing protein, partial [Planctomycetaceae bacterium]|nr:MlrC C-terminal domain-containing protein [Planctomycetaceae bacterium]
GHQTQPHDLPHTGEVASRLLFRLLAGEFQVAAAWRKIPMITPQDQFLTSHGPMKEWFDLCRALEQRPGVLSVSACPMQPWLDVLEGGWTITAYTAGDQELAEQVAAEAAAFAWEHREAFWKSERVAPAEAARHIAHLDSGLVILSDTGDSVYGGAPGDSTILLRELLAVKDSFSAPVLVPLIDPEAVQAARTAGIGSRFDLEVGARRDSVFSTPVRLTGTVAALSESMQFLIEERGECNLSQTALIDTGMVKVALLSRPAFAINHPVLYRHLGLEVSEALAVVVKTASNFQFFAPWRTEMIRCDTAGMTQSNLKDFNWQQVPRPMWPLDELDSWDATAPQPFRD